MNADYICLYYGGQLLFNHLYSFTVRLPSNLDTLYTMQNRYIFVLGIFCVWDYLYICIIYRYTGNPPNWNRLRSQLVSQLEGLFQLKVAT